MSKQQTESAPFQLLTKLECAERQMRVAIRLFFERRDMIAVHTLATAAQEVATDLAKRKGLKGVFEHAKELIVPEKLEEFFRRVRKPQNFFKHADRDPDDKLEFYYAATQYHLFDAVLLCILLKGDSPLTPEFIGFMAWFVGKYPDVFTDDGHGIVSQAKQLAHGLDFDNFPMILEAIELIARDSKSGT